MTKIFVDEPLAIEKVLEINGDNHHHLQVVKTLAGDEILIGDEKFNEFKAEVINVTKKNYVVKIKTRTYKVLRPIRDVTLYVSLPKRKKFEDIIFKCTQAGVSEFVPFISSRTIKKIKDKKVIERWKKKARYGAELCGRKCIPSVNEIISYEEAIYDFSERKFNSGILLWEEKENKYISKNDMGIKMAVFIGPEGGFNNREVRLAIDNGIKIRSLGKLVMDVETACIAGVSLLLCQSPYPPLVKGGIRGDSDKGIYG